MQSVHAGAGFTRVGLRGKKVIPEVGMEANFREFCLILIYLGRSLAPKSDYVAAFERPEVGHAFRAALNMTQIHSQTARPKLWERIVAPSHKKEYIRKGTKWEAAAGNFCPQPGPEHRVSSFEPNT